jgi:hypothetical protein
MEQEGESESSSRVEGSAHTPNFWNRSRWSWVGRTGGSRRYCFWKFLCNLPGDLAWTFFRGAGDGLEIGTVGRASLRAQKLEYLGGCRLALVVMRYHESSLPGVINDRSSWRVGRGVPQACQQYSGAAQVRHSLFDQRSLMRRGWLLRLSTSEAKAGRARCDESAIESSKGEEGVHFYYRTAG